MVFFECLAGEVGSDLVGVSRYLVSDFGVRGWGGPHGWQNVDSSSAFSSSASLPPSSIDD